MNVLNQGHGCRGLIGHISNQHGHLVQACQARCSEPSLAGNDFVFASVGAITEFANQDGLHDALRFDGLGQFVKCALVHAGSRLVHAGHQLAKRQGAGASIGGRFNRLWRAGFVKHFGAEQSLEPAA